MTTFLRTPLQYLRGSDRYSRIHKIFQNRYCTSYLDGNSWSFVKAIKTHEYNSNAEMKAYEDHEGILETFGLMFSLIAAKTIHLKLQWIKLQWEIDI